MIRQLRRDACGLQGVPLRLYLGERWDLFFLLLGVRQMLEVVPAGCFLAGAMRMFCQLRAPDATCYWGAFTMQCLKQLSIRAAL
jgi:hypothetical protein